jgi:polar amino acid transport system substrate-binding protein
MAAMAGGSMGVVFRRWFWSLLLLLSCAAPAQEVVLAYGDQAFPPYQMGIGRSPEAEPGLAIDVVLQTASVLGLQVRLERMPVKRVLHEIATEQLDGGIGYSYTPERAEFLVYPEAIHQGVLAPDRYRRLYSVDYYLFTRADFIPYGLGSGLDGLKQFRVGVLKESSIASILFQQGIPYEAARTPEQSLEKLLRRRLDLVVGPDEPTGRLLRTLGWQSKIRRSGETLLGREYYLVFSKAFCQRRAPLCQQWWDLIGQRRDAIVKQRAATYP